MIHILSWVNVRDFPPQMNHSREHTWFPIDRVILPVLLFLGPGHTTCLGQCSHAGPFYLQSPLSPLCVSLPVKSLSEFAGCTGYGHIRWA